MLVGVVTGLVTVTELAPRAKVAVPTGLFVMTTAAPTLIGPSICNAMALDLSAIVPTPTLEKLRPSTPKPISLSPRAPN